MAILAESQIDVNWPQQQEMLPRDYYHVCIDARDGSVDYANPISPSPIPAWPDLAGKVGLGDGPLGEGPLGLGDGPGVGLGNGPLGYGYLGLGTGLLTFRTEPLQDGRWTLAVVSFDEAGNPASPSAANAAEEALLIKGTPDPAGIPEADSWDNGTQTVTITFDLSRHDEAA